VTAITFWIFPRALRKREGSGCAKRPNVEALDDFGVVRVALF
jgi:hypothetical protein